MRSERVRAAALHQYAAVLRGGTATPYVCLRFFSNSMWYDGEDAPELVRTAVLTLLRHDPFLLATSVPHCDLRLSENDIDACVSAWSVGDEQLKAFLEGHLFMAVVSLYDPDRRMVARALAALERAEPGFRDDRDFLQLYVDALEILDDPRYPTALNALIEATPPEWRSHTLRSAMARVVERSDWDGYDTLREQWAAMPRNAHVCECAVNFVANVDGLRALERGDTEGAVRFLHAAVAVNGCPHLNTGAASVRLARELLARNIALDDVEEHLRAVEQYRMTEETAELRKALDLRRS